MATKTKAKKTSKKEVKQEEASVTFGSYDEAKGVKETSTKELKEARTEFKDFLKETGLKKGKDYSKDKKHGKAWVALNAKVEGLEDQRKAAIAFMKENKPKKSGGGARSTKYNYPEEITSITDKEEQQLAMKKFRTSIRGKAKRAGVSVDEYLTDPAKYDEQAKASKKSEKKEKPEKKAKASKKSKKSSEDEEEAKPEKKAKAKPEKKKKPSKKKKSED